MSVLHIKESEFKSVVLDSEKPVLVDFWATWCGPCKMLGPVLEELAASHSEFVVCKVDVDENPQLAAQYQIQVVPSLLRMEQGKVVARTQGFMPKAQLEEFMK